MLKSKIAHRFIVYTNSIILYSTTILTLIQKITNKYVSVNKFKI